MSKAYWDSGNVVPHGNTYGSIFGRAGNNVTVRGNEITEGLSQPNPSRNMAEASLKMLRFYRKVCRLMPFILRIHNMHGRVTPIGAMKNVANVIKEKYHVRDPNLVDQHVYDGYQLMQEAELHYTQHTALYQYLCPTWTATNDYGYSYLQKVKDGKKTKFLKDFYRGSQPGTF